jgi:hypothetical protein
MDCKGLGDKFLESRLIGMWELAISQFRESNLSGLGLNQAKPILE